MLATHRVGDFRNWAHIEAWAREIAAALTEVSDQVARPGGPRPAAGGGVKSAVRDT
jgi:hypothetical protein